MARPLLAAPAQACAVTFFDFALPVAVGSMAGFAAGFGARKLMHRELPKTQETAAFIAHAIAFWTFGGLTFLLRQRRPHHG